LRIRLIIIMIIIMMTMIIIIVFIIIIIISSLHNGIVIFSPPPHCIPLHGNRVALQSHCVAIALHSNEGGRKEDGRRMGGCSGQRLLGSQPR